jgi:hypothetical protein
MPFYNYCIMHILMFRFLVAVRFSWMIVDFQVHIEEAHSQFLVLCTFRSSGL